MRKTLDTVLCGLDEIPDGEGKGFDIEQGDAVVEIFVVRQGTEVFGYRNVCPHVGTPLNWVDDRFMTLDRSHILCATHGAEFRIRDGTCVAGPCIGDRLTAIEIDLCDGTVVLRNL